MFSWSNGSSTTTKSTTYPGRRSSDSPVVVTAQAVEGSIRPAITRAQHLDSYLNDATLKRSTRRISSDDTTYDTVFQTTTGDTLLLRVFLPQLSPSHKRPTMTLEGIRARHSWCDETTMRVTGYAPIQNESAWRSSGLKLGAAVHAVVKQLQLYPPEIFEVTDPGLRSIQHNANGAKPSRPAAGKSPVRRTAHHNNNNNVATNGAHAPPNYSTWMSNQQSPPTTAAPAKPLSKAETKPIPPIDLPPIPSSYTQVEELSFDQLEAALRDELEFLTLVGRVETYQQLQTLRASVMKENFKKANSNLAEEKGIKELKQDCDDLQKEVRGKLAEFQKFEQEQSQLSAPPDSRSTMKELSKAADEAMEESETIADDWVENGEQSVDEFCKQFLKVRTLHHQRAATVERLAHQYHNR